MSYTVRTGQFEGPLEILLELVEKRKLFINELALAAVTEDYLNHIRNMATENVGQSLDDSTAFLSVAATLLLIKSRALLPGLSLTTEEKESIVDLEDRLRRYQAAREGSVHVRSMLKSPYYIRPGAGGRIKKVIVFTPDAGITVANLHALLGGVMASVPKKEVLPQVKAERIMSIEEVMNSLTDRIQNEMTMSFRNLTGTPKTKTEKVHAIVSFLALLEMVRNGILSVVQHNTFDDMHFSRTKPSVENTTINDIITQ